MRKAILLTGILIWTVLALFVLFLLAIAVMGANAPAWVQNLPGYQFFISGDGSMLNIGGNTYQVREEDYSLQQIDAIHVNGSYQSISVILHEGDILTVRHFDYSTSDAFTDEQSNGVLSIRAPRQFRFQILNFNFGNRPRLEIELPRAYAQSVSFISTSGTVTVEDSASWGGVVLNSTSGAVRVNGDLACAGAQIKTTSGGIYLSGKLTVSGAAEIHSTSGSVHMDGLALCGQLQAGSTSGSVNAADIDVTSGVTLKTTSGSIRAGDIRSGQSIHVDTTSGRLTLGRLHANAMIHLKAVSGAITADAVHSPQHYIRTTSGSITVDALTGDGEVRSTSGRVRTG